MSPGRLHKLMQICRMYIACTAYVRGVFYALCVHPKPEYGSSRSGGGPVTACWSSLVAIAAVPDAAFSFEELIGTAVAACDCCSSFMHHRSHLTQQATSACQM